MTHRVPVLICIDVEPDEREISLRGREDWRGFEATRRLLNSFRPRAAAATGGPAAFSWFVRMDAQVAAAYDSPAWAAARYAGEFEGLRAEGDELGLHTHPWRWDGGQGKWVADFGDQRWVDHCVRLSFRAFEEAFGRRCASFRFGDRWMNDATLRLVEELGAAFDLTLEPGRAGAPEVLPGERLTGAFPDYARVPREPYRPSPSDFRERADAGARARLWLIPLSTGLMPPWPRAPLYRRAVWRLRYGPRRHLPLYLALDPAYFRPAAEEILRRPGRPYLCLPLRADDALRPETARRVSDNLDFLLSHTLAARFSFDTPARAVARLAEGGAAEGR